MKERPILFSAPMVRALLAGTKTQTRRVVKRVGVYIADGKVTDMVPLDADGDPCDGEVRCPYGQPGDRLWVREALRQSSTDNQVEYAVDHRLARRERGGPLRWLWKRGNVPPMHCPRRASRITLAITAIRVERLQAISEADAIAEGIEHDQPGSVMWCDYLGGALCSSAILSYRSLWESINGADSWDANPWVWVVEFKRINL